MFRADLGIDDERAEIMEEAAYTFLIAGGVLSWEKWLALSPESRQAFKAAGIRTRTEAAMTIIKALAAEEVPSAD